MTRERKNREMEIFNTMPHETMDECFAVVEAINDFREKCRMYDHMIETCDNELAWYQESLERGTKRYTIFENFVSSKTGKLIERFINQKDVTFEEIEKEIELSGNPFDIVIHKEDQKFDHEVYGVTCARFSIKATETFYRLNNYDIEQDMSKCKEYIEEVQQNIERITKRKEEIVSEGLNTKWNIDRDDWNDKFWYYGANKVAELYCSYVDLCNEDYLYYGEHGEL